MPKKTSHPPRITGFVNVFEDNIKRTKHKIKKIMDLPKNQRDKHYLKKLLNEVRDLQALVDAHQESGVMVTCPHCKKDFKAQIDK